MAFLELSVQAHAAAPTPEQLEFFEKKIRPVLVDKCYSCHSAKAEKVKGGLLLDTREATLKGGDTGPAVTPGDLEKSLLVKAIRYTDDDLKMPPKKEGKLPADQIADLEHWVTIGAPDPRTGTALSAKAVEMEKARQHWAFKPVVKPPVPAVKNKGWVQSPIDAFVLAKLEEKGMKPAAPADKRTLLRRVTYDLTGLPPTPQEMDEFLADKSKEAFAKVVDRLLKSPHYGERWGRYWLDVARYADTKGYLAGGEERRFPFSHTYRDYVVRAFNDDKPYDRFILEQLAADQLPLGEDKSALAAMGYLTLGRRFLNNQNDIIDDRIDVVGRGLMALTLGCARCHDHKFDPVPTKDYYSLHGVFASSEEPAEKPLLGKLDTSPAYDDFLKQRAQLEADVEKFLAGEVAKFVNKLRGQVGDYLLGAQESAKVSGKKSLDTFAGERKLVTSVLSGWTKLLEARRKQHDPVFAPWFAFAALSEKEFPAKAKELAAKFAANSDPAKPINGVVAKALAAAPPTSLKQVADLYTRTFAETDEAWRKAQEKVPSPQQLPELEREALRKVLYAAGAPANPSPEEAKRILARRLREGTAKLRNKIEELNWTHPGAPARAMALTDRPNPHNSRILLRGNPSNLGPEAPRQFLEVLAGPQRQPFKQGSGRLELAQAIASKDNPLTARVFVNRVWGWHFGQAIVRTPSDFGVRTEAPPLAPLIDHLASTFVENGWSLKKLHRVILLSSAYQQSSEENPRFATLDPGNNLLYRQNRRRLEFEATRDTLLAATGALDLTMGGLPVDITKEPFATRRTIYGFIDRQNLPGVFRTFDFANPDTSSPQRFSTTVPQQALFMMNSPFVVQQARALVARPEVRDAKTDDARVQAIYRELFQRAADKDELQLAQQFLQAQAKKAATDRPTWQYGSGQFDEATKHVLYFERFTNFTSRGWQPDKEFPSKTKGHSLVSATGGHPGHGPKLSSVRRWTAPADGVVAIEGTLAHKNKEGDGIRGQIVSGHVGVLGSWKVHNQSAATSVAQVKVEAGGTIDFIVDALATSSSDSYTWAPKIRYVEGDLASLMRMEWNAEKDFAGPNSKGPAPLSAWEKFAQVLLLSNELAFVD
ncbi:MAG TPA: PSD1 and planctomycete cytochrome C domain-containing protein [Verrucomicrobiae bacterium]